MGCEFYRATKRKARIQHICELCHKTIVPGEIYIEEVSLCSGYDIFCAKECIDCNDIIRRSCQKYAGEEFTLDGINEDIADLVCSGCEVKESCDYSWNQVAQCEKVIAEYLEEER